ncbi:DUF389 domain-containing protein [Tsukamurella paurometabola]|uniref:DUF389 domain-containing protein n=1 Tax=Tsukamurella paurometabola TaxID=2061 RepID=A0A3P8K6I3_TSUPA|nr:DUF389 domain-containing protein [Tsukamurella paurometabola]MBS4099824.1 DUF389 domain-containing protein [Tsukamurella paurometabola]UEA83823.1 DUF389 domain-containing protein [Tsukamurella paurometabola]VDR40969.1 uncharacterized hydrophobic domain [Tsukamurella paurometabola]
MRHIRVISPPDRTDAVLALLRSRPGVTHITLAPGASLVPAGDVLSAEVTREAAHRVLQGLEELRIPVDGAVTVSTLDTVLSDAADEAEKAVPGDPSDAVVWEELTARTREESTLNSTFLAFLVLAVLLAAVGVVTNSPVTVVGAMVVGPEFGPLAAIAVALATRRLHFAVRPVIALSVGFPVAMACTWLGAEAALAANLFGVDVLDSAGQVDFIYRVGPFSLIVALLAGAAGMISMVTAKSAALVGVFISVTTVPAAGYAVVAATVGEWQRALESTGQLAINLVGIVVAGVLVLVLRPAAWRDMREQVGL